jgi:hypothetical protein
MNERPAAAETPDARDRAVPPLRPRADRPLEVPHPSRLSTDDPAYEEVVEAHAGALHAGADTYVDPRSGLTVLTAGYLARRGSCCDSGCRHCPYVS